MSEEVALPRIQQFLGNQRASEAAKQELKTLKSTAKITYMGEFAERTAGTAPPPATKMTESSLNNADTPKPSEPTANASLEKGIAGLK